MSLPDATKVQKIIQLQDPMVKKTAINRYDISLFLDRRETDNVWDSPSVILMGCPIETRNVGVKVMFQHIDCQMTTHTILDTPAMGYTTVGMNGEHKTTVADGQRPEMFGVSHFQDVWDTDYFIHTLPEELITVFNIGKSAVDFQRVIIKHDMEIHFRHRDFNGTKGQRE